MGKQFQTLLWGAPKSLQMVIAAMKLKDTPWKESYDQPRQHIQKQRHYFANKGPSSQGYGFSCLSMQYLAHHITPLIVVFSIYLGFRGYLANSTVRPW